MTKGQKMPIRKTFTSILSYWRSPIHIRSRGLRKPSTTCSTSSSAPLLCGVWHLAQQVANFVHFAFEVDPPASTRCPPQLKQHLRRQHHFGFVPCLNPARNPKAAHHHSPPAALRPSPPPVSPLSAAGVVRPCVVPALVGDDASHFALAAGSSVLQLAH